MFKQFPLIAVIGAGDCDSEVYQQAFEVGKYLAANGYSIICGGLGGVMEAVCKGASEEAGLTIGILPGNVAEDANSYVKVPIVTGMGLARNIIIIRSARAVIAINGRYGTLSEIAYALQLEKPVVGLNTWNIPGNIEHVNSVKSAIQKINSFVRK